MNAQNRSEPDVDEFGRELRALKRRRWLRATAITGLLVAVVGAIPWFFGYGFLGRELFASHDAQVYLMNPRETGAVAEIARAGGVVGASQTLRAPGRQMKAFPILSGRHRVTLRSGTETLVDDEPVVIDRGLFLTTDRDSCYVVFDLAPLYESSEASGHRLPIVARFGPGQFRYDTRSDRVVLPGKVHPDRKQGTLHWIEDFRCEITRPENEEDLQEVAINTLMMRKQRLEDAKQRLRDANSGQR